MPVRRSLVLAWNSGAQERYSYASWSEVEGDVRVGAALEEPGQGFEAFEHDVVDALELIDGDDVDRKAADGEVAVDEAAAGEVE